MEALHDGTAVQVRFALPEPAHDPLIAELFDQGFEGFEQQPDALIAFIPQPSWLSVVDTVTRLCAEDGRYPCRWTSEEIAPRNWNAEWESGIQPITAGPFLIHPPWYTPSDGVHGLCIEPKMSFGTGHHETTRLILTLLPSLVRGGEQVLDAGAGTGVLAIAAIRLGAKRADAFDIDSWSVENGEENAQRNGVADRMAFIEGGMESAPPGPYELILANINRNVLLDMLDAFRGRLHPDGRLVLSGVLQTDRDVMEEALVRAGLRITNEATEGEWLALVVERPA